MSETVKAALESTIQHLRKNPAESKAIFEVNTTLGENLKVKVGAREFEIRVDEPALLGGDNTAPNPVEYVLASLGACQAIMYKALSTLKNIKLDDVNIRLKGHLDLNGFLGLDKNARPGFNLIEYETLLVSDEPEEKLEKLAAQVEALCPVLDIINNPVKTTGKIKISAHEAAGV